MERRKASRSISKRLYPLENRLVEHPVQAIPHQALVILCICSGFLLPWEVLCCDEYSPLEAPQRIVPWLGSSSKALPVQYLLYCTGSHMISCGISRYTWIFHRKSCEPHRLKPAWSHDYVAKIWSPQWWSTFLCWEKKKGRSAFKRVHKPTCFILHKPADTSGPHCHHPYSSLTPNN